MAETHVTLYGDHSGRFEEIKQEMENARGMSMANADVLRELMVEYAR